MLTGCTGRSVNKMLMITTECFVSTCTVSRCQNHKKNTVAITSINTQTRMQTHWALHTANICHQVISYSLLSCLFWISELCELADLSSPIGFSVVCLFVLKVSSRIELSIVCSICKTTLFCLISHLLLLFVFVCFECVISIGDSPIGLSIVCSICKTALSLSPTICCVDCLFWIWHLLFCVVLFVQFVISYCLQHLQNHTLTFPDSSSPKFKGLGQFQTGLVWTHL